jgi:hypothetical protein
MTIPLKNSIITIKYAYVMKYRRYVETSVGIFISRIKYMDIQNYRTGLIT